jgi:hypothetical protein
MTKSYKKNNLLLQMTAAINGQAMQAHIAISITAK